MSETLRAAAQAMVDAAPRCDRCDEPAAFWEEVPCEGNYLKCVACTVRSQKDRSDLWDMRTKEAAAQGRNPRPMIEWTWTPVPWRDALDALRAALKETP